MQVKTNCQFTILSKEHIFKKNNFLIPYNPFLQFAQTNLAYTINKRKELLNLAVGHFLLS